MEKGKTLRLIYALPLPASDFAQLISLSKEPIGCTGDLSLSECLIAEKLPFYELRQHKIETIQALKEMATFLKLHEVADYFEELVNFENRAAEMSASAIFQVLTQENFEKEWKTLLTFIKRHYCFENAQLSELNRHFLFLLHPVLREKEEALISDFFKQKISSSAAYQLLKKEISQEGF